VTTAAAADLYTYEKPRVLARGFSFLFSFNLSVPVDFPTKIVVQCLGYCVGLLRYVHWNMMLETHFADVLEKLLQVRDLNDAVATEGIELVICELPLAYICGDYTSDIIC
jgi:hypothetical protein